MSNQSLKHAEQPGSANAEQDARILDELREKQGHVPLPLPLVAKRPGTVATLIAHRNQVMEDGPLGTKEQALVALSAAVAVHSHECVRTHAARARKAGASEDEVVQAVLIAGLVCGMSPLRAACHGLFEE